MKYAIYLLGFVGFLVSCAPVQNFGALPEVTPTASNPPVATSTAIPALIATISPSQTPVIPTPTEIPCNPRAVAYCITDGHFVLQRPIQLAEHNLVDPTYRYASTANGTRDPHHGVEIGKDFGTPVQSAADGVVVFAGPDSAAMYSPWSNFYGNMVVIHHVEDLFTLYAHLSKIDVKMGDVVQMGEKIGEVGQSGAATGSHLHFEVRRGEVQNYFSTVNPELWLVPSRPEYGAVSLTILDGAGFLLPARLTLQHYSASNEILGEYYLDTYDPHMPTNDENAALGDLPAGRYRITLLQNGQLYERWVDVQSGKLTQAVIVVK